MAVLHDLPEEFASMLPATWGGARIPERMWEPIAAWIMLGRVPGEFLQAVIANDLYDAALRADHENERNLRAFAGFFKTSAPHGCCGSAERMRDWCERGGLSGRERSAA